MPKLIIAVPDEQLAQVVVDLAKHRITFTVKVDDPINARPLTTVTEKEIAAHVGNGIAPHGRKVTPHKKHMPRAGEKTSGDVILQFLQSYPGRRHALPVLENQIAIAGFKAKTASSTMSNLFRLGKVKREDAKSPSGLSTFVYWID